MNSAFALVLTVFLVSGVPVDIAVSVHRTMQECMTAATEQKIPGNCYPVDKVIHQDNHQYKHPPGTFCVRSGWCRITFNHSYRE
ncbi:DUF1482 family protein [Escherichia coli]|uniref:DUF1482 family protein n=2 Tax=Escherichia coli TaxID=562 RepID=UPI000DA5330E|nr:DUF1482 family protein [Escherichia coli]SQM90073.1 putative prophage protein [Escherichia coli]SQP37878.1 putative prophage protein [Escherichia coli]SQQ82455.1 putative prophage protein [Escherichia coli]